MSNSERIAQLQRIVEDIQAQALVAADHALSEDKTEAEQAVQIFSAHISETIKMIKRVAIVRDLADRIVDGVTNDTCRPFRTFVQAVIELDYDARGGNEIGYDMLLLLMAQEIQALRKEIVAHVHAHHALVRQLPED